MDYPPRMIQYINEYGQLVEQGVEYEWLPVKCQTCSGYGHTMSTCRKGEKTKWVEKEAQSKATIEKGNNN